MTKKEIKEVLRRARANVELGLSVSGGLSNNWRVIVERIYNMPRGGPMAAWDFVYTLARPDGFRFTYGKGADGFASFCVQLIARETDYYKTNNCKWRNHYPKGHALGPK